LKKPFTKNSSSNSIKIPYGHEITVFQEAVRFGHSEKEKKVPLLLNKISVFAQFEKTVHEKFFLKFDENTVWA
jgi:hypothetical protein